jgi:hypothetical protein
MTPYKIHSLVRRKGNKTILMITDRRVIRDRNRSFYVQYTVIEPHDPQYHSYANHDGLVPLETP